MVSPAESRANSLLARLRKNWRAFSTTAKGDVLSTAIAIAGIALLFLAASFGVFGFFRAAALVLRLLGAG
jgi:hypothetical protein